MLASWNLELLCAMSYDGLGLPRQFQFSNGGRELGQCRWNGLLRLLIALLACASRRKDTSSLSQHKSHFRCRLDECELILGQGYKSGARIANLSFIVGLYHSVGS